MEKKSRRKEDKWRDSGLKRDQPPFNILFCICHRSQTTKTAAIAGDLDLGNKRLYTFFPRTRDYTHSYSSYIYY
jgi:hypothetical protein